MAFKPLSEEEIAARLSYRAEPFNLAVVACGGQSAKTDEVARRLRRELPAILTGIIKDVS